MSKPPATTRAHETRIEIDAPIDVVWKAITEAKDLARWFAPKMTVEPGVGGFVLADWGPGIEWKTTVEVWEENRHLRLTETRDRMLSPAPVEEKMEPCRLVQDYYLESESGKTVLRLVHSGFGSSKDWDKEYEGTRGGWATCFVRLKHGLERHRNDSVHNAILTTLCYGVDSKLTLERIESVMTQPMEIALRGDGHLCGILPDLNGSIFTVSVQPSLMGSVAYVELMLYGLPGSQAAAIEKQWKATLAGLFPGENQASQVA